MYYKSLNSLLSNCILQLISTGEGIKLHRRIRSFLIKNTDETIKVNLQICLGEKLEETEAQNLKRFWSRLRIAFHEVSVNLPRTWSITRQWENSIYRKYLKKRIDCLSIEFVIEIYFHAGLSAILIIKHDAFITWNMIYFFLNISIL